MLLDFLIVKVSSIIKKLNVFHKVLFWSFNFTECGCNKEGSKSMLCMECISNVTQCQCHPNVVGMKCDQCSKGHYDFPKCKGSNLQY